MRFEYETIKFMGDIFYLFINIEKYILIMCLIKLDLYDSTIVFLQ